MTVRPTNCHLDGRPARHQRGRGRRRPTTPAGTASARSRPSRPGTSRRDRGRRPGPAPGPPGPAAGRGRRHRLQRLPRVPAGPRPRDRHRPRARLRRQRVGHAAARRRAGQRPHQPGPGHRGAGAPRRRPSPCSTTTSRSPSPSQIADGTAASGLHTNLVCSGLKPNAASTYAAAQVVLAALNQAIAGAVADARAHHVTNVHPGRHLRRPRRPRDLHGATPGSSRASRVPDTTLAADAEHILAAKACTETDALHGATSCASPDRAGAGGRAQPAGLRVARRAPDGGGTARHRRRGRAPARRAGLVDRLAERPDEGRRPVGPLVLRAGGAPARSRRRRRRPPRTPRPPGPASTRRRRRRPACRCSARMRSTTFATSDPRSARSPVTPMRATA